MTRSGPISRLDSKKATTKTTKTPGKGSRAGELTVKLRESVDKNNRITRQGPALGGLIGARPDCGPIGAELRPAKRGLESEKTFRKITNDLDITGVLEGRKGTLRPRRPRPRPRPREAKNTVLTRGMTICPDNGGYWGTLARCRSPHHLIESNQPS